MEKETTTESNTDQLSTEVSGRLHKLVKPHRMVCNGLKYKLQIYSGWWRFKKWRDLGNNIAPIVWVCTYYDTEAEAQESLDKIIERAKALHEWREV